MLGINFHMVYMKQKFDCNLKESTGRSCIVSWSKQKSILLKREVCCSFRVHPSIYSRGSQIFLLTPQISFYVLCLPSCQIFFFLFIYVIYGDGEYKFVLDVLVVVLCCQTCIRTGYTSSIKQGLGLSNIIVLFLITFSDHVNSLIFSNSNIRRI